MPQLAISLLGPFQVTQDGQLVTEFETDLARALLAYLVMHAGSSFSREALAALFWPDSSTTEALHALRQTLNRLRSALGDAGAENSCLRVTRRAIQFNVGRDSWLDVTTFTGFLAATRKHPHRCLESCRACNEQLLQASRLWRGDFLAGLNVNSLPFQEWLTTTRERLRIQAVETFDHLANHYEQAGDYEQVRSFAWRQLELEPWREEAHQQLMRVLAQSGQRNSALAQYGNCRRTLKDELDVEPAAETTALYEQIRSGGLEPPELPHSNLPVQSTAFVGRETELAQITELLQRRDCRLLTLVGLGGMGKTRLAVQIAAQEIKFYRDGVTFIPLSALTSPDQVLTALAQALQITIYPQQDLATQLYNHLRQKEILLVLDSFEHVLGAAGQVSNLLGQAPDIQVLVTSRERLNLQAEWVYEVHGLAWNHDKDSQPGTEDSAMKLFIQAALRVRPGFTGDEPVITHICQLVDGMPLAIELAAAWTRVLSCPEIAQEIQRDLGFLHTELRDVPEHHRSLQAVFASAWALLTLDERRVLSQLSVFRGGFDRAAVTAVTAVRPPLLAALADKSWLHQDQHEQEVRYGLHDLVQRYTAGQLANEPDDETAAGDRHCHYYAFWLQQLLAALKSNDQRIALDKIGAEIENIRAAWGWAIARRMTTEIDLAWESLFLFYDLRSWLQEGENAFEQLAQAFDKTEGTPQRIVLGRALFCQGWFASLSGRNQLAKTLLEHSVVLLQISGAGHDLALALNYLGTVLLNMGLLTEAKELCQESQAFFREIGDDYDTTMSFNTLGLIAYHQGNYAEAEQHFRTSLELAQARKLRRREAESLHRLGAIVATLTSWAEALACFEQALACYRELGNARGESSVLLNLGATLSRQGDYFRARTYLKEALQIKQQIGDRQGEAVTLMNLGTLDGDQDEYGLARSHYVQALSIAREIGDQRNECAILQNIADIEIQRGNWASADDCTKQALTIVQKIGDKGTQGFLFASLGGIALREGDFANAWNYLEHALATCREIGFQQGIRIALINLALLSHYSGDQDASRSYSQQTLTLAREAGNQPEQARAQMHLGHALRGSGKWPEASDAYQQALDVYHQLGKVRLAIEAQAGLASIALAQGNLAQAQIHVTDILNYLSTATLDGTRDPIQIYLTCYLVLCVNQDARARDILTAGYNFLQERAAKTSNEQSRRLYLENIPAHHELLAEWSKLIG